MTHVLVVDDSAVVREAFTQLLSRHGMLVTTARDPIVALEKIRKQRPDVIVLDLEMPRMDGMTFLRNLMKEDPIPVVVCSGLTGAGTPKALQAIEQGAIDVIEKPRFGVRDFLYQSSALLVDTIAGAARARLPRSSPRREAAAASAALDRSGIQLMAIGASTGGPSAVRQILQAAPSSGPPIVVVQHMARTFTGSFARWLNECCDITVREAASRDPLRRGEALIAPGDRHLRVVRAGDELQVVLSEEPSSLRHRPSVDVMFESVAQAAGAKALGILLTGMGADGAAGLLAMRTAGAVTIAQDEATSVVFGMPKEAIACGAAAIVLPLPQIAATVGR